KNAANLIQLQVTPVADGIRLKAILETLTEPELPRVKFALGHYSIVITAAGTTYAGTHSAPTEVDQPSNSLTATLPIYPGRAVWPIAGDVKLTTDDGTVYENIPEQPIDFGKLQDR